jgi:hypothetical protein
LRQSDGGSPVEMESGLTRAITIIALTCFLVAGAAVTSILCRERMQAIQAAAPAPVVVGPVANRAAKRDRLTVVSLATAAFEPSQSQTISEPLRQAYAASTPADIEAAKAIAALPQVARPEPARPKAANKPPQQKPYALLSDVQIAGIKERLKLSADQQSYWPPVENALRAVARKIHAARQADPNANASQIDPDSEEVQQLKSAALPLLFQLREDQKEEVRKLARIIGLDKVASAI